ncbi:MAG: hypothetical protein ACM3PC_02650 [Deltaproteobacteria bacterium]
MLALLAAAVLIPASADGVLAVENAAGLRALFTAAGVHAPSLAPAQLGASLRANVGVDLFAEDREWGLAPRGPRMLVFSAGAVGLSAPVRDAKSAKKALAAWLAGGERRAGELTKGRLLTASGRGASALLVAMTRLTPLPRDLAARARGPAWLWVRLGEPLRAAVLSIDASATGVVARGLLTASSAVLVGASPAGCERGVGCIAAGLGPAGAGALASALERLGIPPQPRLRSARTVVERLDGIDAQQLAGPRSIGRALVLTPAFDGLPGAGAGFQAFLDLEKVDAALSRLTPIDALRGADAAGAYAAHLIYGALLRNAGPLGVFGDAAPGNAAEVELRLPLR